MAMTKRAVRGASAVAAAACLCTGLTAHAELAGPEYLSTKQPYVPPSQSVIDSYSPAPADYQITFTEAVARHGSRGLSSYKYDALLSLVAQTASAEGGFVSDQVRDRFRADVEGLIAANVDNGYGMLTDQGREQHRQLGQRAFDRNPQIYSALDATEGTITVSSSGEARASESGQFFISGLTGEAGRRGVDLSSAISPMNHDPATLYFHQIENPDGSEKQPGTAAYEAAKAYESYLDEQKHDGGTIKAALDFIDADPRSQEAARAVLAEIFTEDFINQIGTAGHTWYNTSDGTKHGTVHCAPGADPQTDKDACGDPKKKIKTSVDLAMTIYNAYIIQANMETQAQQFDFDFSRYFAIHPEAAEWFAYVLDAEDFYEKGPSLMGHRQTFLPASALAEDFLNRAQNHADGTPGAHFGFGHAETIIPFAALIGAPGSTVAAPDVSQPTSPNDVYNYAANPWRGESVAPMAANIQWDVATRSGTDPTSGRSYTPLVRMLYNEVEAPFKAECVPVAAQSHWYKLSELRACLMGGERTEDPSLPTPPTSPSGSASPIEPSQPGNTSSPSALPTASTHPTSSHAASDGQVTASSQPAGRLAATGSPALAPLVVASLLLGCAGAGTLWWRRVHTHSID